MCGRYVSPDQAALERFWHLGNRNWPAWIRRRFNVAPTTTVPILLLDDSGTLQVLPARWGLIPSWWKKPTPPRLTFNARSEEAASKPTWRESLRHRRCLMPAEGWYEWREAELARNASGRLVHQPYYIHCPAQPVIAFAGLWAEWRGPDGNLVTSCALLSREAAPAIHHIHDRMPLVLPPRAYNAWLAAETATTDVASLVDHPRTDLIGHRVGLRVNSARNDGPELVRTLDGPVMPLDEEETDEDGR